MITRTNSLAPLGRGQGVNLREYLRRVMPRPSRERVGCNYKMLEVVMEPSPLAGEGGVRGLRRVSSAVCRSSGAATMLAG